MPFGLSFEKAWALTKSVCFVMFHQIDIPFQSSPIFEGFKMYIKKIIIL